MKKGAVTYWNQRLFQKTVNWAYFVTVEHISYHWKTQCLRWEFTMAGMGPLEMQTNALPAELKAKEIFTSIADDGYEPKTLGWGAYPYPQTFNNI